MFRNYKNWAKLIKFIIKHRKEHRASFQILTTASEIIVIEDETDEQLRINEKL